MIIMSWANKPEGQSEKKPSGYEQVTKIVYLPGDVSVRIEYPHNLKPDVLSAVEIIVLIAVPALAQVGVTVSLARVHRVEKNVRISLYENKEEIIKEYEYPVQQLLDVVREARSRLLSAEGSTDLIAKALEDLDASRE